MSTSLTTLFGGSFPQLSRRACLALVALAVPVAYAQDAGVAVAPDATAVETKLPKGEQILDDFIEATGGRKAMRAVKSVRSTGTMKIPALGLTAPMTVLQKTPDKFITRIDIEGIGEIVQATNKGKAWAIDPTQGARLLEGDELAAFLREADFHSDLNRKKYFKKIECVEKVDLDGKEAWKVELTTLKDKVETNFYDVKTKLLVKQEQKQATPLGEIALTLNMLDYKKRGEFLSPTKIVVDVPPQLGGKRVIEIQKVEYNKEIEDSEFDMPEEVQELIDG
jgi:hypothetical protein